MDFTSLLLFNILACLVFNLVAVVVWLRSWKSFLREYREGQEAMTKLLLGNFSALLEALRSENAGEEGKDLSPGKSARGKNKGD